jgi:hypothetical protein
VLSSSKASNWVDRGEPGEPKLRQILAHYLGCPAAAKDPPDWLAQAVADVVGMVAADASEVQLAGHVRALAAERGRTPEEARGARLVAVALWHAAKAADVRDRAERVLRAVAASAPGAQPPPLGDWLAARLLSPGELAEHRRQARAARPDEG